MTNPYDPAFTDHPVGAQVWTGLTKREYFAAMALQGICGFEEKNREFSAKLPADVIARMAVAHADALIAELNK